MVQMNYSQSRNRETGVENKLTDIKVVRRGGKMYWEVGVNIYTPLCVKCWVQASVSLSSFTLIKRLHYSSLSTLEWYHLRFWGCWYFPGSLDSSLWFIQLGILHNVPCAALCLVAQSYLTLCDPIDCSLPGSSVHGDSPGKNTGVVCHAFLQGIFQPWNRT